MTPSVALRRNLVANWVGQAWVGLMMLAFIPTYIKYLGIEVYGLIGIFTLLQTWLLRLDMGITPTLTREMARIGHGTHTPESIRDLLRSIEILALGIGFTITIGVWAASAWLASDWLRAERVPVPVVAQAVAIMGGLVALRFVEGIYRSSMIGLQSHVLFNIANALIATVRSAGAFAVLAWVSPTIQAFFIWQGLASVASIAAFALVTYRTLPSAARGGRFSTAQLRGIGRFAGGMVCITFLALLLTQVDKIILSRLLVLSEYGYYTLAATVAGALYLLVGPIGQAWFPRLSELHAAGDTAALVRTYHQGAQLVSVIVGSVGIVVILFAEPILYLWTRDADLARRVAPLVSLLTLGNLLNALMWIPYKTQLAYGWTGLTARINLVSVLVIVPAILWATPLYGPIGAAWVWVALNAAYVVIGIHFMYRKILTGEKTRWYAQDIFYPLIAATFCALLVHQAAPTGPALAQLAIVLLASGVSIVAALLAAPALRHQVWPHVMARIPFRVTPL